MPAELRRADPRSDAARALLAAAREHYLSVLPGPLEFVLTPEQLAEPGVVFLLAGAPPEGCVAMARREGYGELKALYVAPRARGTGLSEALVAGAEAAAREAGLALLRLETQDRLAAAVRLYRRLGYRPCARFGDYPDDPHSVFLEKPL